MTSAGKLGCKLIIGAMISALVLAASGRMFAQTLSPEKPSVAAAGSQTVCLKCHGPYEKLIAATANYYMPSGETTSPHKYVPHKSKNIPNCNHCHKPHSMPPDKQAMAQPSTDWCYSCHHAGALECGTCHK